MNNVRHPRSPVWSLLGGVGGEAQAQMMNDRGLQLEARGPKGVIYPVLLLSILVLGVATAGVAQLWSTQVKREKEAELLFRLGEFRRGIALFRADHNRWPKELDELLEDRSRLQVRRYLRRIYTDPMTKKDDWKLDTVADRTGAVSGIRDLHSRSQGKPLKVVTNVIGGPQAKTYQDW